MYIEYEGTHYSGWQVQKNSRTIQGILLNVAKEIFKNENIDIQGSGRTDSGVHALCQVAHLDVQTMLAPEIIRIKLNDLLPYDINILDVEKAATDFHARHDAIKRSYIYQISKRRTAFGKNYVWWIKDNLNIKEMVEASKLFLGMHDFISFTDEDKTKKSTKALIDDFVIKEIDSLILIRIAGSHFLWKMVRRIIGTLVEVGRENITRSEIEKYLTNPTSEPAKYTAPPSGLFLEKVLYKGEELNNELIPVMNISGLIKSKIH